MSEEERRFEELSLGEQLYQHAGRFPFFQAVRMLRKVHANREAVGRDADPDQEFVRFRSALSYAFPTSDIAELSRGEDGEPDDMVVNFMGLATPNSFGSLPLRYVEEIQDLNKSKQTALGEFIDMFNHRLISLMYRSWERSRPEVLYELGEKNAFESAIRSLIGIEGEALRRQLPFEGIGLLSRAGLLARRPASKSAIEGLVASLFGIPANIQQFVHSWYEIDASDKTQLGRMNSELGTNINLGSEVSLCQSRFRVVMGPMDFDTYRLLLPDGASFDVLNSSVRLAAGPEFEFDFSLVLRASEVPRLRLGNPPADEAPNPCRLGWSTWIRSDEFTEDAADAAFMPSLRHDGAGRFEETRA